VLVDRFLDTAVEIDVDALYDGTDLYIGGIMEHIEEAGIHSGDSACVLPPFTLGRTEMEEVRSATLRLAEAIGVRGLLNIQFALAQDVLYVLEANPRASRTVPFVAKATGVPLARAASRVMLGASIAELREEGLLPTEVDGGAMPPESPFSVKEAILPFRRFRTQTGQAIDSILGPEMRSTGEVMGIDAGFGATFATSRYRAIGEVGVVVLAAVGVDNVARAITDKCHQPRIRASRVGAQLVQQVAQRLDNLAVGLLFLD